MTGWLVPVTGDGVVDGVAWAAGECVTITGDADIHVHEGADVLFAYPGDKRL